MLHVCVQLLSRLQLFETLWTITRQAPLFMGFSRQEHLSGLSCPTPGNPPDPWVELASLSPDWYSVVSIMADSLQPHVL